MVGARELAEEPPIDVGFSLMWCFKPEGGHRTFIFVLNLQEDQHRKLLDCRKFKERTTWNKPDFLTMMCMCGPLTAFRI